MTKKELEVKVAKRNIKHLENIISDMYFRIATLEADVDAERKHLQSICPHTELMGHAYCMECGLGLEDESETSD